MKAARYSPLELETIRTRYVELGRKIMDLLPGRDWLGVQRQASKMRAAGEATPRWSEAENAILERHYAAIGGKVCQLLPGKTATEAGRHAREIGLRYMDFAHVERDPAIVPRRLAERVASALTESELVRLDITDDARPVICTDLNLTPQTVGVYARGVPRRQIMRDVECRLLELAA